MQLVLQHCCKTRLNCDVASFTTHIKPVLQQIRLLIGLNVSGKTGNIVFQFVWQQCCIQVARFCRPCYRSFKLPNITLL